jgi:hypothetical protein
MRAKLARAAGGAARGFARGLLKLWCNEILRAETALKHRPKQFELPSSYAVTKNSRVRELISDWCHAKFGLS